MAVPLIYVVTSHGRQLLEGGSHERLIDVMTRLRVPWSGTSIYVRAPGGDEPVLNPCLDRRLGEIAEGSEILLYFNRNVNPFLFDLAGANLIPSEDSASEATEYFYQWFDNEKANVNTFLKKLSVEECRRAVGSSVVETVTAILPKDTPLVVGVSGGGDSNALLHGLSQVCDHGLAIHPLIIMGTPEWDAGVPRAKKLCRDYGLELTVYDEGDVKELLGIDADSPSLVECFEREFKGDDFEFLGTLLVRLALFKHARDVGTQFVCTGLNLEDILCEALFRISSGLKPASFPSRAIGGFNLLFPLWMLPKRVIDGCFPNWSLDNYAERYPCFSLGRNFYYSLVYNFQSQFPGYPERLARGLSQLSLADPVVYELDEQLNFHVERFVPFPLRERFRRMMKRARSEVV